MSEQNPQNQNIPTEEELRARDDAIFDTVANFRNELDSPNQAEQAPAQTADEFDSRMDALEAKMNAAEAKAQAAREDHELAGTGRRRKAYSVEADEAAAKAGMQYRAKRVAQQMAEGVSEDELQGLPTHRGQEQFFAVAQAKKRKNGAAINETLEEAAERAAAESAEDPDALARAEAAVRGSGARVFRPTAEATTDLDENTATPEADTTATAPIPTPTSTPTRSRTDSVTVAQQAFPAYGSVPRPPIINMTSLAAAGTPGILRPENAGPTASASGMYGSEGGVFAGDAEGDNDHAIGDDGHLIGADGRIGGRSATDEEVGAGEQRAALASADIPEEEPVTVTPEASLRRRVVGRIATAKAAMNSAATTAARGAKEMVGFAKTFANYGADLAYRKPEVELTDEERRGRSHLRTLGAVAGGVAVAAAALGANNLAQDNHMEHLSSAKENVAVASPTPGETQQFGPQAPKTSETPSASPSGSASASPSEIPSFGPSVPASSAESTPTATETETPTVAPTVEAPAGPTIDFSNKPPVPEPESSVTPSAERTVQAGNEQLKFSADGKEVTVTLNRGGTVWDGVTQAERELGINSDATATANAVQTVGFKAGEANQLPVGAHVSFKLQDGKLVAQ